MATPQVNYGCSGAAATSRSARVRKHFQSEETLSPVSGCRTPFPLDGSGVFYDKFPELEFSPCPCLKSTENDAAQSLDGRFGGMPSPAERQERAAEPTTTKAVKQMIEKSSSHI